MPSSAKNSHWRGMRSSVAAHREDVKSKMPAYLLNTIIPRNVRLSEAPSYGKSIIYYDIKSKGAQAYLQLAQEVAVRKAI